MVSLAWSQRRKTCVLLRGKIIIIMSWIFFFFVCRDPSFSCSLARSRGSRGAYGLVCAFTLIQNSLEDSSATLEFATTPIGYPPMKIVGEYVSFYINVKCRKDSRHSASFDQITPEKGRIGQSFSKISGLFIGTPCYRWFFR